MRCTRFMTISTRHLLRARRPLLSVCLARLESASYRTCHTRRRESVGDGKSEIDAKQEEMDKAELETKQMKEAYENAKNEQNETVVAKKNRTRKQSNGPDSKATRGCVGEHGETPSLVEEGRSALS